MLWVFVGVASVRVNPRKGGRRQPADIDGREPWRGASDLGSSAPSLRNRPEMAAAIACRPTPIKRRSVDEKKIENKPPHRTVAGFRGIRPKNTLAPKGNSQIPNGSAGTVPGIFSVLEPERHEEIDDERRPQRDERQINKVQSHAGCGNSPALAPPLAHPECLALQK